MTVPDVSEYFDKFEASFEKFVKEMKNDYSELSSEVKLKLNRDMETLKKLKERMREAMMQGREAVSSYDWSKRLRESMVVLDEIKVH